MVIYLVLSPTIHTPLLLFLLCILNPHKLVQLVIGHLQIALNILSYPESPILSLQIASTNFLKPSEYIF